MRVEWENKEGRWMVRYVAWSEPAGTCRISVRRARKTGNYEGQFTFETESGRAG